MQPRHIRAHLDVVSAIAELRAGSAGHIQAGLDMLI